MISIFKIDNKKNKSKPWHISKGSYSFCGNATVRPNESWHQTDDRIVKHYDGEELCSACVGQAYKAGLIDIVDKERTND